jgi:uncharacterized phiE125 gp8 family phage protein
MNLHRITPPAELPVSLAEVKAAAKLDGIDDSEDPVIAGYIRASIDRVDGPDGWIQRALLTQTWELRLDAFPGRLSWNPRLRWPVEFSPKRLEIELPLPPLQSVQSITYVVDDNEIELDPAAYQVIGAGGRNKARIRPIVSWPGSSDVSEAVRVRFVCGYGDSWNDVPEAIRSAIILMTRGFYDDCESDVAQLLLRPYRVDLSLA